MKPVPRPPQALAAAAARPRPAPAAPSSVLSPAQPFLYLLGYISIMYVRPHEFVPALQGVPILPACLAGALLFWLARQPKRFEAPQFRLMFAFWACTVLSLLFTGWVGGATKAFGDFIPILLLFILVATSLDSIARFRALFTVLGVAAVIMSLHGIDQARDPEGIGWSGAKSILGRITYLGFLADPNDLSMSLLMTLPLCLYLSNTSGFLLRWAWRAAVVAILYAVYLSNSRGAILTLGCMMAFYSYKRYGIGRSLLVLPVLAVPLLLFAPSRMSELSADEASAEGRVEAWYDGIQMLKSSPLFGVGKDMFMAHHFRTAHNSYVLALSELGLVGYFVWLSIIVLTALMIWKLADHVRSGPAPAGTGAATRTVTGTAAGGPSWSDILPVASALRYSTIAALVSIFFLSRTYTIILYLHIGVVIALYQLARATHPDAPEVSWSQWWPRLLLLTLGSTVLLWIITLLLL